MGGRRAVVGVGGAAGGERQNGGEAGAKVRFMEAP